MYAVTLDDYLTIALATWVILTLVAIPLSFLFLGLVDSL